MSDEAYHGEPAMLRPSILLPFLAVTLIWGCTWIVIRDQLAVVPPSWSVAYRFLTASVTMFVVTLVTRAPIWLGARGFGFAALFGCAQFVFNFNFVYRAEQHITSGLVALVFALLFVPNALFARIFLGQRVSGRFLFGSALGIAGIVLLFVNEARGDGADISATLTGIALTLGGVISASISNVMQATKTARALPMASVLAWGMLIGALLDAAYAWATVGAPVIETRLTYLFGVAYLGVIGSALAFTLYFGLIRRIGPARAAYTSVIVPVVAMLISTLAEGYIWTWLAASGAALAMVGMLIALSAPKPSA